MKRIILSLMLALGLVIASMPAASAAQTARDCVWKHGDAESAKFCLLVKWERAGDGKVRVLRSRLQMTSSSSDNALGYQGMYDIRHQRTEVRSGDVVHSHWGRSTETRRDTDWHNTKRGYIRVTSNFDINWKWWPDNNNVYLGVTLD